MKRLFADTFFFYAVLSVDDSSHHEAIDFQSHFDGEIITTEWILVELADGLCGGGDRQIFIDFHRDLRSDPLMKIVPSDSGLFAAGVDLFARRPDKRWSLTDCISFVAMELEGLTEALTGDHHFEQAGYRALLRH